MRATSHTTPSESVKTPEVSSCGGDGRESNNRGARDVSCDQGGPTSRAPHDVRHIDVPGPCPPGALHNPTTRNHLREADFGVGLMGVPPANGFAERRRITDVEDAEGYDADALLHRSSGMPIRDGVVPAHVAKLRESTGDGPARTIGFFGGSSHHQG